MRSPFEGITGGVSSAPAFLSDKSLRCALISAQTEKTALPGLVFLQKTFRSAKSRVGYEICGLGMGLPQRDPLTEGEARGKGSHSG